MPLLDRSQRDSRLNSFARELAGIALLLCAVVLAYLPAFRGTLLWDDSSHATSAALQSLHGLWRIWTEPGATQQYYPFLHSAFWFEHLLWGDAVLGYHLLNVALHAASAYLVVRIVRRLSLPGAWLAGFCFALHPIAVEAVAWISEQKSVLSGFFFLAAALCYLAFDESRKRSRYIAALCLFLLALLSKTVTAMLPAVLLVILWWRRGTLGGKRDIRPLVPWFAIGAAAGLFTAWMETVYIGARGAAFALSLLDRILLAGRVLWFYAAKILWPAGLAFFYPRWRIDSGEWWQYLFPLAALATAFLCFRLVPRTRAPLAAFLCFAGLLFPVLGFLNVYPFRYSFVADHFAYLATLAIIIPAIAAFSARIPRASAALFLLPALLGFLTWNQAAHYSSEETLYRATLDANPDAWLAHNNLGNILLADPAKRDEAISHFQAAIRLQPDFWEAHLSLGNAYAQTPGRFADAVAEFETAVRLAPESGRAHTNLGNALLQMGRTAEAIDHLRTAIRLEPANAEAHNDLGNAYLRLPGRVPDAIAEYQDALRLNFDFPEAHNNLGRALAQSGRLPESIAQFQIAIRLKPDYWGAHSNLGNALSQMPGREADAIAEYQAALRIRPDSPAIHNNLGNALARVPGRLPDAIAEFRQALLLAPDFADAHYNLGAALEQMPGHRMEALSEMQTALRLKNAASK